MKKLILILALFLTSTNLFALDPPYFEYDYDGAGNRTHRVLVVPVPRLADGEKPELDVKINVYPNPTPGRLNISISELKNEEKTSIKVLDLEGRVVVDMDNLQMDNPVDLTDLPNGAYIIVIQLGKEVTKWKIIKQN
jgi:type IX secretion system substrate protein